MSSPVALALADLKSAFPRQVVTADMVALYQRELADLQPAALDRAVRVAIRTGRYFPTIAELREHAAEFTTGLPSEHAALAQIDARIAWARVSVGQPPPPVHPLVADALAVVGGYAALRDTDTPAVARGQFARIYRERRADAIRQAALGAIPPTLEAVRELPAAQGEQT